MSVLLTFQSIPPISETSCYSSGYSSTKNANICLFLLICVIILVTISRQHVRKKYCSFYEIIETILKKAKTLRNIILILITYLRILKILVVKIYVNFLS